MHGGFFIIVVENHVDSGLIRLTDPGLTSPGFNNNPGERTTLLIDFFKESEYTKEKFEKYFENYSKCFEGLENLVDIYESRKTKK